MSSYSTELLSSLISLTFLWPLSEIDGHEAFKYVHGHVQQKYHAAMNSLETKLVSAISVECRKSEKVLWRLDKPNIHRLLEVYRSTILHFTHAMFCLDMAFEGNHQPLKSALLHNTIENSHMSAVNKSLGTDRFGRPSELIVNRDVTVQRSATDETSSTAKSSLLCSNRYFQSLMLGELVSRLPSTNPHCTELLEQVDERLDKVLDTELSRLIF